MSPPGPLVPLIAIPTTSGTGSEATSVAVFDDEPSRSKTGIAHRSLRPTLGIIDPDNVMSLPSAVALYSGLDVLCHAVESYTAIHHSRRPGGRPASPYLRPSYQGSNPMSDVWSLHALGECATFLPNMVDDPGSIDGVARTRMCHASSAAGHAECAAILADARIRRTSAFIVPSEMAMRDSPGEALACELLELMNELHVPVGIRSLGYDESDVESLARGTLPQHRVTKLSPRQPVEMRELRALFADALDG